MSRAVVEQLLTRHGEDLARLVRHEARGLLRFEGADDLAQGIRQRAIEKAHTFAERGDAAGRAWLRTVARSWLNRRRAHWSALKRDGGALLRFTLASGTDGHPGGVALPSDKATGPATLADRFEQVSLATRALELLLERDRDLVRWSCEGQELASMAARLELTLEACGRARLRALERLRKAYRLVGGTP